MLEYNTRVHAYNGMMALKTKSTKVKFSGDKSAKTDKPTTSNEKSGKSKHIIFDDDDDDGQIAVEQEQEFPEKTQNTTEKKHKGSKKSEKNRKDAMDIGTLWYQTVGFCN